MLQAQQLWTGPSRGPRGERGQPPAMTSLLDNLDCSSDGEDINQLFPKCRGLSSGGKGGAGRPDVNLNMLHDDCNDNHVFSLVMSSADGTNGLCADDDANLVAPKLMMATAVGVVNLNGLERRGADADDEDTEEEDDEIQDYSPSISRSGTPPPLEVPCNVRPKYLRDSRIEIAGGRELYSQSKSKAGRAKRFQEQPDTLAATAAAVVTVQAALVTCGLGGGVPAASAGRGVWEVRGKGRRPTARAQNAPLEMITETVFSTEVRSIRRVSDASRFRAAFQQQQHQPQQQQVPRVVYEASAAALGAAEVVVFDDISECLAEQHLGRGQLPAHQQQNEEDSSAGSSSTGQTTPPAYQRPPSEFFKVSLILYIFDIKFFVLWQIG